MTSPVENFLLLGPTKKSITHFSNVLSQSQVLNLQDIVQTWQNALGVNIDQDEWNKI